MILLLFDWKKVGERGLELEIGTLQCRRTINISIYQVYIIITSYVFFCIIVCSASPEVTG